MIPLSDNNTYKPDVAPWIWVGWDWMVSGWGEVLSTFNSANKEKFGK